MFDCFFDFVHTGSRLVRWPCPSFSFADRFRYRVFRSSCHPSTLGETLRLHDEWRVPIEREVVSRKTTLGEFALACGKYRDVRVECFRDTFDRFSYC